MTRTHFDASANLVQFISGDFSFLYEKRTGAIEVAEKSNDDPGMWPIGKIEVADLEKFINAIKDVHNV